MKTLVLLVAVGCQLSFAWNHILKGPFDNYIINVLECIRSEMNQGIPERGVPHFNPLLLKELDIKLEAYEIDGIFGVLKLNDLELHGITQWELTRIIGRLGFFPPSYNVKMTINFPKLILRTNYLADCTIDHIKNHAIYGNGVLEIDATNFTVDIHAITTIWPPIKLRYFNAHLSMDPLTSFNITGLFGDEQYSAEISKHLLVFGNQIIERHSAIVNKIVYSWLLNPYSISDSNRNAISSPVKSEFNVFKYVWRKCKAQKLFV